jgi:prevent-host-death family protein
MSKTIGAAKFKENCLSLLDDVDSEGIIITKNGKPVAKLISIVANKNNLIGIFSKLIKVKGSTLSTGTKWDAES